MELEINEQFQRAINALNEGNDHVFITGSAGTGKSSLLKYFCEQTQRNIVILAPTGIAALNVGGQTIHSFFGFPPDITLDRIVHDKPPRADRRKLFSSLEIVVIDEISMVRADLLDCVSAFLCRYGPRPGLPFGGVKMVFFGDLYQLPPIVTQAEREVFSQMYDSPYFFNAHVMHDDSFFCKVIELNKVYRQTDSSFVTILQAIRNKTAKQDQLSVVNQRVSPSFVPPENEIWIELTSTNDAAATMNEARLEKINTKEYTFSARKEGTVDKGAFPTDTDLRCKVGAQVMMVVNDRSGQYANGTLGQIIAIEEAVGADTVVIVQRGEGGTIELRPYTWHVYSWKYDEAKKAPVSEIVGSFTQYPFRLAWAVTIHKSQGKTFDRAVIDLTRIFAPGQAYVALSRCRSLEGMVLRKPIEQKHLIVDFAVSRFYHILNKPESL